jgi:hypothetical protein
MWIFNFFFSCYTYCHLICGIVTCTNCTSITSATCRQFCDVTCNHTSTLLLHHWNIYLAAPIISYTGTRNKTGTFTIFQEHKDNRILYYPFCIHCLLLCLPIIRTIDFQNQNVCNKWRFCKNTSFV